MTTQTLRRGGLDWTIPQDGKAADAYAVAITAGMLSERLKENGRTYPLQAARHATRLHVISGLLHRLSERQCNEDLTCRECAGSGLDTNVPIRPDSEDCKACAGTGLTTGRREKSLQDDAREIAQHYGLACYFQGDPRGCSLYLIDPSIIPTKAPGFDTYTTPERWIDANYTRGHAVVRLGR